MPTSIRYGMGAIKGVGASAVEAIIEERAARGAVQEPAGFVPAHRFAAVNRRVFEALIRSGSLDRIGPNRATLTAELERAMHLGEQNSRAMSVGPGGFVRAERRPPENASWRIGREAQRLAGERETSGCS